MGSEARAGDDDRVSASAGHDGLRIAVLVNLHALLRPVKLKKLTAEAKEEQHLSLKLFCS